ncbi:hypothetical protein CJ231_01145 [Hoylesella buccalis]|uniref:Uncharacterized protein n=1 Tax=Hoylesella buccalis TaxID=28127 RepID=A0A2N6QTQ4_9BACT|nr:hypothetical protein CJ231_01145 [Hoylesella buccalis]
MKPTNNHTTFIMYKKHNYSYASLFFISGWEVGGGNPLIGIQITQIDVLTDFFIFLFSNCFLIQIRLIGLKYYNTLMIL